jgi:hypothetical protein
VELMRTDVQNPAILIHIVFQRVEFDEKGLELRRMDGVQGRFHQELVKHGREPYARNMTVFSRNVQETESRGSVFALSRQKASLVVNSRPYDLAHRGSKLSHAQSPDHRQST